MLHPLQVVPGRLRTHLLLVFGSLTLAMLVAFSVAGWELRTREAPLGIVSLELARDAASADRIIQSWKDSHAPAAVVNTVEGAVQGIPAGVDRKAATLTMADFLFILLYGPTFAMACVWLGERSRFAALGVVLGWLVPLAALSDAVEDLFLLRMLSGDTADPAAAVTSTCATLKFLILLAALAYIGVALAARRGPDAR